MRKIIKKGDFGDDVKLIQKKLGLKVDGKFGPKTEKAIKDFQDINGLYIDGIVGEDTQKALFKEDLENYLDSEITESLYDTLYLDAGEYFEGPSYPEYIYIHHTAGWHNPTKTIRNWNNDTRGEIATEFVIGGQSIKGNDESWDGRIVKCLPDGAWGWHLGTGRSSMHKNSVGIEVNNFGYLIKDGDVFKTYVGTIAHPDQVFDLGYEWRGHRYWHNYSDQQIASLKSIIEFIGNRDGIDISKGLKEFLQSEEPGDAFEFKKDALAGKIKGVLSHSNVRKGKTDMYPHPKLIEMLKSL
jgi:hypothetical protein